VRLCRIDGRSTMVSSPHELNTLPKGVYVNADATPGEQGRLTVKP